MNAIKVYNNMKVGFRLLIQSRSVVLGFIKSPMLIRNHHISPPRFLGLRCINQSQKPFSVTNPNWGQSRVFPATCCSSNKNGSSKPRYVSDYSTKLETSVNDKNFEKIYVQGVDELDEKTPVVVEKKDETVDRDGEESRLKNDVQNENLVSLDPTQRVESEAEKEAWRLLKESVVTYCGSPVGTLAANDAGDKTPLNYDQVFIRDFVPSALAFLLRGEGEIVRNFLLHTLQLQVILAILNTIICI